MTTNHRRIVSALLRPPRSFAERITERADAEARAAGLTVEVLPRGARRYRDPRLDQIAARRACQYAGVQAGTAWSPATLVRARCPQ
jgi:hypothetical protein